MLLDSQATLAYLVRSRAPYTIIVPYHSTLTYLGYRYWILVLRYDLFVMKFDYIHSFTVSRIMLAVFIKYIAWYQQSSRLTLIHIDANEQEERQGTEQT